VIPRAIRKLLLTASPESCSRDLSTVCNNYQFWKDDFSRVGAVHASMTAVAILPTESLIRVSALFGLTEQDTHIKFLVHKSFVAPLIVSFGASEPCQVKRWCGASRRRAAICKDPRDPRVHPLTCVASELLCRATSLPRGLP